jgi:hypothetical protein
MPAGSASRTAALAALGLSDPCSPREIAAAYRRLARATHPDSTGVLERDTAARFTWLTDAYHLLVSGSDSTTTSPAPPPGAARSSRRDPPPVAVRYRRPPIVAGPVRVRSLPPRPRGST